METLSKEARTAITVRPANKNTSKFITLVETAYQADNISRGYNGTIASLVRSSFSKMSKTKNTWKRATFKTLLLHLYSEGCFKVLSNVVYMDVLVNISTFGLKMIRPIEAWGRPSFSPDDQLEDLIDHLFARYATPVFLISAFYESSLSKMLWYIKLGQGASTKELTNFPEHLTARMTHIFKETPRGYDITQALIRAQALGYGATDEIANRLAYSAMREKEGNEMYWNRAIQFFAKAKEEHLAYIPIIINYLEFTLRRDRNFSLKGRTFKTLIDDATAWNAYTAKMNAKASQIMWYPSGIELLHKLKFQDEKEVLYQTVELLNANDLYDEGQVMNHCVGEYVDDCVTGSSAIFSLRKLENGRIKRLATVEIDPKAMELVEAQGKCNTGLSHEALSILKTWCTEAGIHRWQERPQVANRQPAVGGRPSEEIDSWTFSSKILRWIIWFLIFQCIKAYLSS